MNNGAIISKTGIGLWQYFELKDIFYNIILKVSFEIREQLKN